MLRQIWKKAEVALIGGTVGGAIGVIFGILIVSNNPNIQRKYLLITEMGTATASIGFAIDGITGFTRKVRSRDFLNCYEELKTRLEGGGLDPNKFLLIYIQLNYYTDLLDVTNSDKIRKNSKQIGDELSWIVENIFPRIRSEITREDLRNTDFLIDLLFELHGAFLDVNQGHDNWLRKLKRNRQETDFLIKETIKCWRNNKAFTSSFQGEKLIESGTQPKIEIPIQSVEIEELSPKSEQT